MRKRQGIAWKPKLAVEPFDGVSALATRGMGVWVIPSQSSSGNARIHVPPEFPLSSRFPIARPPPLGSGCEIERVTELWRARSAQFATETAQSSSGIGSGESRTRPRPSPRSSSGAAQTGSVFARRSGPHALIRRLQPTGAVGKAGGWRGGAWRASIFRFDASF